METRVMVVVDNTPSETLKGEWGLSVLVEKDGKKVLLDAGASELFAENLAGLGFSVADIDYAVLSHAHYDHGNGMRRFFRENTKASFYVRREAAENCYHKKWLVRKYIGLPKNILTEWESRIVRVEGDYSLMAGVTLVPHKTPNLNAIGKREMMFQRVQKGWKPDDFSHEQSLVVETERGLLILNSCSHGGAANIIREVRETFPDKPVYGLIGGLHLFNKTEVEIRAAAQSILDTGIQFVCTGHCTKDRAYAILQELLGEKLSHLHVGLQMTF